MDLSNISSNYDSAKTGASAASANSLQNSLKNISADSTEDELKGVIKDFESYFVEQSGETLTQQLYEQMRRNIGLE